MGFIQILETVVVLVSNFVRGYKIGESIAKRMNENGNEEQ